MKNFCNFAVNLIHRGVIVRLLIAGIFCACTLQIYSVTPARNVNASDCPCGEIQQVGNTVFCCHNEQILSVMNLTEKICPQGNNSTLSTTSAGATSVQPKVIALPITTKTKVHADITLSTDEWLHILNSDNDKTMFLYSKDLYSEYVQYCLNEKKRKNFAEYCTKEREQQMRQVVEANAPIYLNSRLQGGVL
jgi:hypothetical protein